MDVIGDRRDVKSEEKRSQKRREEKRGLELDMSDDHSGSEGSVGHEADFVYPTKDMEVELRLRREVDME